LGGRLFKAGQEPFGSFSIAQRLPANVDWRGLLSEERDAINDRRRMRHAVQESTGRAGRDWPVQRIIRQIEESSLMRLDDVARGVLRNRSSSGRVETEPFSARSPGSHGLGALETRVPSLPDHWLDAYALLCTPAIGGATQLWLTRPERSYVLKRLSFPYPQHA
jgi:hypothetical protein